MALLKHLFSRKGRASRLAFIGSLFIPILLGLIITPLIFLAEEAFYIYSALLSLLIFLEIPSLWIIIANSIKRLHDIGYPSSFIFLALIPIFNLHLFFILLSLKGKNGENKYGPNPSSNRPFFSFKKTYLKNYPLEAVPASIFLLGRYLFATFFLYGFWHKLVKGWLWTDIMSVHFSERLGELLPGSFQALYLEHFAIPLAMPIAWIVTVGELIIGMSLVFGLAVRINAAFALFLVLNFAAGGYYNLSLPPFMIYSVLLMAFPSGHWLGMDKKLHEKYPDSLWFL